MSPATRRGTRRVIFPVRVSASLLFLVAVVAGTIGWGDSAPGQTPARAAVRLVTDTMDRKVPAGWGDADAGGRYTVSSPGDASVSAGTGNLSLRSPGSSMQAVLAGSRAGGVDGRLTFSLPSVPSGGNGLYAAIVVRKDARQNSYRARVRVTPDGGVRLSFARVQAGAERILGGETALPIRLAAGQVLVLRARVTGANPVALSSSAWLAGDPPPGAWQHTVTDADPHRVRAPGSLGVWSYLSRGGSSSAVMVREFTVDAAPGSRRVPAVAPSDTPRTPLTTPRRFRNAGSVPVGTAHYTVPAGATFVAPNGRDSARGTAAAPLRTIARAVAKTGNGGTVVLRGGSYHESVRIPRDKTLTVQAYPREAVWLDGSSPVRDWWRQGRVFAHDGWTARFDSSPTYRSGAAPSRDKSFQFVGPRFPMAAHPDQVWIDGVAQRQVGSLAEVRMGTFYVDYPAHRLVLGTDPTGHDVRASDLAVGLTIKSPGSVVRGIGVRRYATSLPDVATVKAAARNVTLENVAVTDSATTGISALARHVTLRHVTAKRSGMLGIHANYADDLQMLAVRSEGNNTERFKVAPVAGGIKITRSRQVSVLRSIVRGNAGTGIWLDESVYDAKLTGNDIAGNAHHGISLEISAKGLISDNVVKDNADDGVRINNTSDVQIWNNTLVGNWRTVNLVQDGRSAANPTTPGHDPRQRHPDPSMTWLTGSVSIGNNLIAEPRAGAPCLLCVEDLTHRRSAAQMGVTANGNAYVGGPFVWSRGAGDPATYESVGAFRSATGQEQQGQAADGVSGAQVAALHERAIPLPYAIATAIARPAGAHHIGAWR